MNEPKIRRMSERKAASVEEGRRKERPVIVQIVILTHREESAQELRPSLSFSMYFSTYTVHTRQSRCGTVVIYEYAGEPRVSPCRSCTEHSIATYGVLTISTTRT